MSDGYQQGHRDGSTQGAAAADVITELTADRDRLRCEVEGLTTRLSELEWTAERSLVLLSEVLDGAEAGVRLTAGSQLVGDIRLLLEQTPLPLTPEPVAALVGEPLPPKKDAET